MPIDCLKIDRSFVTRLESGSNEAAVVRSILLLGSSLGKAIVAEGIETPKQLQQLQEMGCKLGQGYLLARPQKPGDVSSLLAGLLPGGLLQDRGASASASASHAATIH